MASALIVLFLSCWLAGQSGVSERLARSLPASRLPNNGERRSPMTDDAVDVQEPSYPKPKISLHPSGQVTLGGAVTIQCECWCRGARFLLSKAGEQDTQCSTDLVRDVAEFPICSVSQGDAGSYSCRYSTKWDPPIWSEPSDPVELVIAGGNNDTQLETEAAPTRSGSTGPGTSTGGKKSLSTPPGTEGTDPAGPQQPEPPTTEPEGEGKGPAPRQSRESEPATTVYALRGEGTQLDVLPREPDPVAEGLTYAELDRQALQAKRGGPAPAPEPVLYATIDVS
ncbi:leukocyte immunoglobulin-like receptor subfamily B member 2 isoform X4 [Mauremys reevesii]|uniref:leukocyte immunoglobulin-like receptor subfamily B member 2 isoform X4 n=1 Tax=Mauremys reevesii TaxID=260615 RepID=UPI0019400751|nr:leukocyte immunoglobulin-like receptor subfamily B member 2 isoform X4 [Mauremys reevesii]